jgi:PHD/YefM family antitoxin component YafN of YafNO toxin-antitoxin module
MKTLELRKASRPLADYASDLGSDSLIITSNNKPVAALVSLKNADRESIALGLSPVFGRIIRSARAEAKRGKVSSLEQVKNELAALSKNPRTRSKKRQRSA